MTSLRPHTGEAIKRQMIVSLTKPPLGVVLNEFALVNRSNSQLTFDGGDQWRPLEQSARQRLQPLQI